MTRVKDSARLSCFGSGVIFAALSAIGTAALGGSISYNDPSLTASPYVKFTSVSEEWSDAVNGSPDPVLSPPAPSVSLFANGTGILFDPQQFLKVDTSGTSPFDLRTKATTLRVNAQGQVVANNPGVLGYALNDIKFTIGGELSVWAPLSNPPMPFTSYAQANVAANYTVVLKQVNWQNVQETTKSSAVPLDLVQSFSTLRSGDPSIMVEQFGPGAKQFYTWTGNLSLTQGILKSMFGITDPHQYVTEVGLALNPTISVVGVYGEGYAKVTTVGVSSNSLEIQPVPEPPTIILAGLGAAAAVGHGYRRRKLRQRDGEGSDGEWNDEEGAIALTA